MGNLTETQQNTAGTVGGQESLSPFVLFLQYTSTVVYPLLVGYLVYETAGQLAAEEAWVLLGVCIVAGMLLADLVSGTVHWLCDTYGTEETPVFGKNVIKDFREHHIYPENITQHDFVESNGNICVLGVATLTPALFLLEFYGGVVMAGGVFLLSMMSFWASLANIFHKWAHQKPEDNLAIVRILQKYHLILNPDHHELHHTAPYQKSYNITFGWLNPLLDRTGYWRGLEKLLAMAGIDKAVQ